MKYTRRNTKSVMYNSRNANIKKVEKYSKAKHREHKSVIMELNNPILKRIQKLNKVTFKYEAEK